jgi:coenzyme PQQ precursor peptide PqqA
LCAPAGQDILGRVEDTLLEDDTMKWETPSATVWRFGFEITAYIAYR